MKFLLAIWEFIAGDSKRAPIAVAIALAVAFGLTRYTLFPSLSAGIAFAIIVALGLTAAVFEREG
jgi:hypothetical protein